MSNDISQAIESLKTKRITDAQQAYLALLERTELPAADEAEAIEKILDTIGLTAATLKKEWNARHVKKPAIAKRMKPPGLIERLTTEYNLAARDFAETKAVSFRRVAAYNARLISAQDALRKAEGEQAEAEQALQALHRDNPRAFPEFAQPAPSPQAPAPVLTGIREEFIPGSRAPFAKQEPAVTFSPGSPPTYSDGAISANLIPLAMR